MPLLPVTAPRLPASVLRVTVSMPLTMSLPLLSFSWTVMVLVLLPSAAMLVGLALIVLVAADAAPTVKVTLASPLVIALLFTLPLMVATPAVVELVKVAL